MKEIKKSNLVKIEDDDIIYENIQAKKGILQLFIHLANSRLVSSSSSRFKFTDAY